MHAKTTLPDKHMKIYRKKVFKCHVFLRMERYMSPKICVAHYTKHASLSSGQHLDVSKQLVCQKSFLCPTDT